MPNQVNSNGDSKWENRRLAQSLAVRVVELEEDNRRLQEEVLELLASKNALSSKNKLFEAKILELQARLESSSVATVHQKKFRSPLVPDESGSLRYRFERPNERIVTHRGAFRPRPRPDKTRSSDTARNTEGGERKPGDPHPPRPLSARTLSAGSGHGASTCVPFSGAKGAADGARSRTLTPRERTPRTASDHAQSSPRVSQRASPRTRSPAGKVEGSASSSAPTHSDAQPGAEDVEMGLEGFQKDLEGGMITSETELLLEVEYCVDTGTAGKALAVRHNPVKYTESAEVLENAINVTFEGWRVSSKVTRVDLATQSGLAPPAKLPLGAFEVYLVWEVAGESKRACLHSKLTTRKFPEPYNLLAALVRLFGSHVAVLSVPQTAGKEETE